MHVSIVFVMEIREKIKLDMLHTHTHIYMLLFYFHDNIFYVFIKDIIQNRF